MDFEWIAFSLGDVAWIGMAFVLGMLSKSVGLPPLVGFLATGFLLNVFGIVSGEMLQKLSDLGITLLLFIVGLKLNLRTLAKPQVWTVTSLHTSVIVVVFGATIYILALFGTPFLAGLDLHQSLLIAFALSFSSTVFVVKALEEKGEMASLHGRIAIGILIVQDIAAVVFLAISTGKWPSLWALAIVLLIPLRLVLHQLLQRAGHGELLVLFGFLLALGGAEIFEMVGLKGDLGALVLGLMIANHVKADEMAKTMLGFKDLFLLGFFLSIGLSGPVTMETVIAGAIITPFVFLKSALFFGLLTGFKLRARISLFASLNLTNFSEFGLIVAAVGVANGWINAHWLIVIAIALFLSCAIAAVLNVFAHQIHARHRSRDDRRHRHGSHRNRSLRRNAPDAWRHRRRHRYRSLDGGASANDRPQRHVGRSQRRGFLGPRSRNSFSRTGHAGANEAHCQSRRPRPAQGLVLFGKSGSHCQICGRCRAA